MPNKFVTNTRLGMRQAKTEFVKEFPNADLRKFYFDVDLTVSGDIEKTYVYYRVDKDTGYDITSDTFWRHEDWVRHLNLTPEEKMYFLTYGKNLEK